MGLGLLACDSWRMSEDLPEQLRVEVVQGLGRGRLWAWTIYRGFGEAPIDGSQAIFPTRAVAERVGIRIRDAFHAPQPISFAGRQ